MDIFVSVPPCSFYADFMSLVCFSKLIIYVLFNYLVELFSHVSHLELISVEVAYKLSLKPPNIHKSMAHSLRYASL